MTETEKELSYKTNKELSGIIDGASKYLEEAINGFDITQDMKDSAFIYVNLMREAAKRLRIEPHITFEDAQFDM